MTVDWPKVREFVHRRTLFVAAAILTDEGLRLFPIGSLRIQKDGSAHYFEMFAAPVPEGAAITFLAVNSNPIFWLRSLLMGKFPYPPALRLHGTLGVRRESTEAEKQGWFRRVGWLLKTPGGKLLWSQPRNLRSLTLLRAEPVRVGQMSKHLRQWCEPGPSSLV